MLGIYSREVETASQVAHERAVALRRRAAEDEIMHRLLRRSAE